ncbi:MAG: hypothetical protein E6Q97_03225 [Desulfurellales bacterium]|nr:MAG: hypothetical protein E6Q97_03225 [Desulfurellales bacterium]
MSEWDWHTNENDEVYVNRGDGSGFRRPTLMEQTPSVAATIKRVEQWSELAKKIGLPNGCPLHWTLGVIYAESGGDPNAVSNVGALGLMQVMPETAKGLGYTPESMKHPPSNIGAGTSLLGDFREQKFDLPASLSMYNAGPSVKGGPKESSSSPWGYVENVGYIERATAAANYFRRKELAGSSGSSSGAHTAQSSVVPLLVAGGLIYLGMRNA